MQSAAQASTPAVALELGYDLAQVKQVAKSVRAFLLSQACEEVDILDCELALVEACNNAIKYTPALAAARPVQVVVTCDAADIELQITDHGPGFDLPANPQLPAAESEGGRGLYLIFSVMDGIQYRPGPDGNTLVLQRKRALQLSA